MKKNKVLIVYLLGVLIVFFAALGMPFLCVLYLDNDNTILLILDVIIWISIAYSIYRLLIECINKPIEERCELVPYLNLLEKLSNIAIFNNDVRIHFTLIKVYLIMGSYDKALDEMEKLRRRNLKLSKVQEVEFNILYISYLSGIESDLVQQETEKVFEILTNLEGIDKRKKEKLLERLTLQKYLQEEKWEKIIQLQSQKNVLSIFNQVENAYLLGLCYYNLKMFEKGSRELNFVIQYGGDTKYVSLATHLLEKMPVDSDGEKKRTRYNFRKNNIVKYILVLVVLIGCLFVIHFYNYKASGNSVIEVYCKSYWINNEEEIQVLYQHNIDNYELIILCDGKNIAYGIYERDNEEEGAVYRLCHSYRVPLKNINDTYPNYILTIDKATGNEEFTPKAHAQSEIWDVIENFYKKYKIISEEGFDCVGISFSSYIENIEISGQNVEIEKNITIDGTKAFIWKAKFIDLKTVDFFDFKFS